MRVLHVFDHSLPLHSGYAFRSAAILREQGRLGWDTAQVTGPKHACGLEEESADGFRFLRTHHTIAALGRVPVVNQLDVVAALRRRLAAIVRDWRPQVIHAHSPCLNGLAAARVACRHGVPLVYELRASWEDAAVSHGTTSEGSFRYRLSRALETRVVRGADAVTTICEGLRRDILERGVAPERVTVIPNAVDLEQFSGALPADPALRARFCAVDTQVLGFFGSFYAYEGLDVLIRALPLLLGRGVRVHLLLVGGGPEEERLRSLAEVLGVAPQVTFVGRVPQRDIPAYYAIADALVYPRRANRLTELVTPLKPLEAMAQGKIVMASSVGGHRELVRDRATGFLFAPDDPGAIADCAAGVLANPELDAIRRRARLFVEEERTWRRVVAGYRPVYERLVRDKPARFAAAGAESDAA